MTADLTRYNPAEYISHSQLHDWLLCRQRWYLKYVLGIKPIEKPRAMDLGSAVHMGLASFFKGGYIATGLAEWQAQAAKGVPILDDSLEERIEEIRTGAVLITNRALADFKERGLWVATDESNTPIVEKELRVPIADSYMNAVGFLDLVAYDPKPKQYWIVDFKVRGTFQSDDSEDVNLQNAMYQYMAAQHGIPTVGTLTYQIASKPPSRPKMNKDGRMSRARIATDWETFKQALLDNNLDPAEYEAEMRSKLDVEFVKPLRAYRSEEFVNNIWDSIVRPSAIAIRMARKMAQEESEQIIKQVFVRNMSQRSCNGCAVRSVCIGRLKGYDPVGILNTEYEYKTQATEKLT